MNKVIFGITTQSSSSSSSSSENEDEDEESKMKDLPVLKRNEKVKDKKEVVLLQAEVKDEAYNEESEPKNNEKVSVEEAPVKRKRGRPLSLDKKCPPKKIVKKPLSTKKNSLGVITGEKRPRGRPKKIVDPANDNTPVKLSKTKIKSPKENGISEGTKSTKHVLLKTKSPVKESEIDENITSTTERIKDPDAVEDETVSSSCQDLVRSVKVQTKPISKKPPKSYINKVSFYFFFFVVSTFCKNFGIKSCFRFELKWKMINAKP